MLEDNDERVELVFTNATGGSVGRLIFSKDKLDFEGVATESAKLFIDAARKEWLQKIPKD